MRKKPDTSTGHGFYVETYGGERFISVAWYQTRQEAERHAKRLMLAGYWQGMPPRVTPTPCNNAACGCYA